MSLSVSNGVLAGQAGVSALGSSGVVTGSGSAKNGIRVSGSGNSSNNARKKKLNYNPREIPADFTGIQSPGRIPGADTGQDESRRTGTLSCHRPV